MKGDGTDPPIPFVFMPAVFLRTRKVNKRYGGVAALHDVDLEVRSGEVHCLVGENGSGKSTLVKVITGVVQPEPGAEVAIDGVRVESLTPREAMRRGIQVVHQDLSLFPNLTVAENIGLLRYLETAGGPIRWGAIREIARGTTERIGVTLNLEATVGALPVADQQLVAICRALASDARMLIMDEPTASITRKEVNRLLTVLTDLRAQGVAVLFISHKLDEILEVAQRVTVLRDGTKVGTFERGAIDRTRLIQLMTGKDFAFRQRVGRQAIGDAALEVTGLSKRGNFADISFTLRAGEVLGIIGPLGSGKTELALSLFGMNPPDTGTAAVDGQPVRLDSNTSAIHAGIAYVPKDRLVQGIVARQPVGHNLIITTLDALTGALRLIDRRKTAAFCEAAVRKFDIRLASLDLPASALSGGNQQKLVIAKWLSVTPRILILDGPTIGIDVGAKETIYEIIRSMAREDVGVLLISEEVPEVFYNCDRILLMKNGRIVAELGAGTATEEDLNRRMAG